MKNNTWKYFVFFFLGMTFNVVTHTIQEITGFPWPVHQHQVQKSVPRTQVEFVEVPTRSNGESMLIFTQKFGCLEQIVSEIDCAKKAVEFISQAPIDPEIADALIRATQRGLYVEILRFKGPLNAFPDFLDDLLQQAGVLLCFDKKHEDDYKFFKDEVSSIVIVDYKLALATSKMEPEGRPPAYYLAMLSSEDVVDEIRLQFVMHKTHSELTR